MPDKTEIIPSTRRIIANRVLVAMLGEDPVVGIIARRKEMDLFIRGLDQIDDGEAKRLAADMRKLRETLK